MYRSFFGDGLLLSRRAGLLIIQPFTAKANNCTHFSPNPIKRGRRLLTAAEHTMVRHGFTPIALLFTCMSAVSALLVYVLYVYETVPCAPRAVDSNGVSFCSPPSSKLVLSTQTPALIGWRLALAIVIPVSLLMAVVLCAVAFFCNKSRVPAVPLATGPLPGEPLPAGPFPTGSLPTGPLPAGPLPATPLDSVTTPNYFRWTTPRYASLRRSHCSSSHCPSPRCASRRYTYS